MKVAEWDDKFLEKWRYEATFPLDDYLLFLKDMITRGLYILLEIDEESHIIVWEEYVHGKRCLWIEFGYGRGLCDTVRRIIIHSKSHGYEVVRTNVERIGAKRLYERMGFKLTHYAMELIL